MINNLHIAVPAISPRNRYQSAPTDTKKNIHSITGPVPALSKTDQPGLVIFGFIAQL